MPSTHRFATTLPQRRATIWNQRICFSAKLSPTFGSFDSALISAFSMSISDNRCLASWDAFSLTFLCCVFFAGQSFPPLRRTTVTEALEKEDYTARQARQAADKAWHAKAWACLLGILGCFQFDVPLLCFLGRTELPAAAQDSCHRGAGERRLHSQAGKTSCRQGMARQGLGLLAWHLGMLSV